MYKTTWTERIFPILFFWTPGMEEIFTIRSSVPLQIEEFGIA